MCELFGVSSPVKIHVNDLLEKFFSHGKTNPDGWGMAFFNGNNVSIEKQPTSSIKSIYLRQRMHAPINVGDFFAHVRYATRGDMVYHNCHPFTATDRVGRNWTMIHNGTIYEFDKLSKYCASQEGTTDSERILLYIVDQIDQAEEKAGRDLSEEERFRVLDSLIGELAYENKLNLMLYDGSVMYVHTNFRGSLYMSRRKEAMIFTSTKLDNPDDSPLRPLWEEVPFTQLLAFKGGQLIYTGTNHGNEFIDSEEKRHLLFLDYSAL